MQDFTNIDPTLANNNVVKTYLSLQDRVPRENLIDVLGYNYMLGLARAEQGWSIK